MQLTRTENQNATDPIFRWCSEEYLASIDAKTGYQEPIKNNLINTATVFFAFIVAGFSSILYLDSGVFAKVYLLDHLLLVWTFNVCGIVSSFGFNVWATTLLIFTLKDLFFPIFPEQETLLKEIKTLSQKDQKTDQDLKLIASLNSKYQLMEEIKNVNTADGGEYIKPNHGVKVFKWFLVSVLTASASAVSTMEFGNWGKIMTLIGQTILALFSYLLFAQESQPLQHKILLDNYFQNIDAKIAEAIKNNRQEFVLKLKLISHIERLKNDARTVINDVLNDKKIKSFLSQNKSDYDKAIEKAIQKHFSGLELISDQQQLAASSNELEGDREQVKQQVIDKICTELSSNKSDWRPEAIIDLIMGHLVVEGKAFSFLNEIDIVTNLRRMIPVTRQPSSSADLERRPLIASADILAEILPMAGGHHSTQMFGILSKIPISKNAEARFSLMVVTQYMFGVLSIISLVSFVLSLWLTLYFPPDDPAGDLSFLKGWLPKEDIARGILSGVISLGSNFPYSLLCWIYAQTMTSHMTQMFQVRNKDTLAKAYFPIASFLVKFLVFFVPSLLSWATPVNLLLVFIGWCITGKYDSSSNPIASDAIKALSGVPMTLTIVAGIIISMGAFISTALPNNKLVDDAFGWWMKRRSTPAPVDPTVEEAKYLAQFVDCIETYKKLTFAVTSRYTRFFYNLIVRLPKDFRGDWMLKDSPIYQTEKYSSVFWPRAQDCEMNGSAKNETSLAY